MPTFGNTNNVLPRAQRDRNLHHPPNQQDVKPPDFCTIHKYKCRKKRRNYYHPFPEEGEEYIHIINPPPPPDELPIIIRIREDKDVTVKDTEGFSRFLLAILSGFTDLPRIPTIRIRESGSLKGRW